MLWRMAVSYIIKFAVKPEQKRRFVNLLNRVLDKMREEPTFHEAVLHRDPNDENCFLLFETWESHDDVVKVQLKRPYRQEWHAALDELLVEQRGVETWSPLRADRAAPVWRA